MMKMLESQRYWHQGEKNDTSNIYALNNASFWDRRRIIYIIKNQSKDENKVRGSYWLC